MPKSEHYPLEVFYDGSCVVCSLEMENYMRNQPSDKLVFVDISAPGFDAETYGRTQEQFMSEMHVRDANGDFFAGVDAFLKLWWAFPEGSLYRVFASLISFPGIRAAAGLGYALFARTRFLLPKRRAACDDGSCHLNHPRS